MNIYLDEASYYFGGNDDTLKEKLRKIEGVPNATYLVKEGMVFVFAKLIELVKNNYTLRTSEELNADIVLSLVPEAMVTALEAVEQWSIVPLPYKLEGSEQSGWTIRHQPFNALIPEFFPTLYEAGKALAKLLVGDAVEGAGNLVYRDQQLSLSDQFTLSVLPTRPDLPTDLEPANYGYKRLAGLSFEDGFAPVTKELFDSVQSKESTWQDASHSVMKHGYANWNQIWQRTDELPLSSLNDANDTVPEYAQSDFDELKSMYPELSMLTDGSLYQWFDTYQMECCYINGWTANRDNSFLFYLLGKLVSSSLKDDQAKNVGEIVGFALARGDSWPDALTLGSQWNAYDDAIKDLSYRIAEAMRFLAKDKAANDLRGDSISTMADLFRGSRKMNMMPVIAEQSQLSFGQVYSSSNPVESIKTDTDYVMSFLVKMADITITPEQREDATKIALAEAEKGKVTIFSFVTAFEAVPALKQFADALRKVALQGEYGWFFDDAIDVATMPVNRLK